MPTLYYTPMSPYSRKVRITAIEKGLDDSLEKVVSVPFNDPDALIDANPLNKVPALVLDDGQCLFDSPVICAYLNAAAPAPDLTDYGDAKWKMATYEALTDGILDAAVSSVMEERRPPKQQSAHWLDRWVKATNRSLDLLEEGADDFLGPVTLAQIGLGAMLGYLDFRRPNLDWRTGRPRLMAWYEAFLKRPSMSATMPENV